MKQRHYWLALVVSGCGLINSNTLSVPHSFDAQPYRADVGDATQPPATMPTVACDANNDPCAMVMAPPKSQVQCDLPTKQCIAVADLSLPYGVDVRQQQTPLPGPVETYAVDHVNIDRVAYWLTNDSLNVAVPQIDLYVAPFAANDASDPKAQLIGSVASLPAHAASCADARDTHGDSAAGNSPVCDVKLSEAGAAALASYVRDYKTTPFKLIAHTRIVARGGDPMPTGMIEFWLRLTVSFSLLK
jgi:hypothetical protein